MKIVALVGSLRKDSFNMQLVMTIKERYSTLFDLDIADIGILPYYNEDTEVAPPREVEQFKRAIAKADAVLISTPEYNWSTPGVKKCVGMVIENGKADSREAGYSDGVTQGGLGTVRAQLHLRQVLLSIQAITLPPVGNEILIGFANKKFEDGKLKHEVTLEFLDEVMERFIGFVRELSDKEE